MSLLKQLFLAICLFLVVAFSGSFVSSVENSREQLRGQLRSHAQDAATALGLSLTPHVDDPAMVQLMVSSIFDSGYFASIRVIDIKSGKPLVERVQAHDERTVPGWFARLVDLQPQGGDALIMRGWEQAARVSCGQQGRADWLLARSRGGEFAVLAPGCSREQAERLAEELCEGLENLARTGASDLTPVAYLGISAFAEGDSPADLLAGADQALAQAESQPAQPWASQDGTALAALNDSQDWHDWIDQALTERRLLLYFQPVVDCLDTQRVLHHKVLARLLDPQATAIAAGRFLPWIERFGWAARLDLAMLEQSLEHLRRHPRPLALSLSAASVRNAQAFAPLLALLKAHPQEARQLTLELDERHLPAAAELERLSQVLRELGCGLGLQHFGGRFSLIGNLTHLGLAYLKLDGCYLHAVDREGDKRLFIEAVYRTTHSIDLPLIAEQVETHGELEVLREMGLRGAMGRLFGSPAPWSGDA